MIIKTVRCPSYGGVRFIEFHYIVNPILKRLVPEKSVHFMEVSVLQRCPLVESGLYFQIVEFMTQA